MPSHLSVRQEAARVAAHIGKAIDYLREGDAANAELCLIDAASLCEFELSRAIEA
jgi:hypothetical protein